MVDSGTPWATNIFRIAETIPCPLPGAGPCPCSCPSAMLSINTFDDGSTRCFAIGPPSARERGIEHPAAQSHKITNRVIFSIEYSSLKRR